MALSDILKNRRKALGYTLLDIAKKVGVSEATVQRWESGNIKNLRQERIAKLSEILEVSPSTLMGWETEKPNTVTDDRLDSLPSNITLLPKMKKVPLVGQIACGAPILAEENIEDYVDLPGHIRADYALTCKGDSMINAGIRDGDIVYIRQQETVENGQIAAVMVDREEATLKRFYFDGEVIQLVAENPKIMPMVFAGENANRVRVIGMATAYTHVIE
ncbi:LexA family protein [Anaerotruncus rubiinfantis]|uniref:LexA family protein n=1 Tax=Anaerotruncus rubiinfantis TaxID=1720200 RepID=UPI0034A450C8